MPDSVSTEYRIVIEGCGAEAVTSPLMESVATHEVERIEGLIRDGISIEEECDIGRAENEGAGMTITIVDRQEDDAWTTHFSRYPDAKSWLTDDIDATTDPFVVRVDSTFTFAEDDFIHIGTECMQVLTVIDGVSLHCSRAMRGTMMQAHYTEEGAEFSRPVVTGTWPLGLQGRRVRVYEYVVGEDDLQGDGNLIWRGILSTEPSLAENGGEWTMTIESPFWLTKQDVGGDTESAFSLRGYYYSAVHPLTLAISEVDFGQSLIGSPPIPNVNDEYIIISGHFETVADLVAEINVKIAASPIASFSAAAVAGSISAVAFESGGWGLTWRADSTETAYIYATISENHATELAYVGYDISAAGSATPYTLEWAIPQTAPRGVWGPHTGVNSVELTGDNNPHNIYPSGLTLLNEDDTLTLEGDDALAFRVIYEDDATRTYQITGPVRENPFFTPETAPRFTRHTTYVARGTLADFRDALVANGPTDANRGAAPFLTDSDLASWDAVVARAAANIGPLAQRRYIVAQATKLDELLSNECRILGVFPRLESDGRIGLAYLEMPTATTPADFDLDDDTIIIDERPPAWEPNIYGTLNTARLLTGYDPTEDEHTGPSFDVRDVTSLSIRKKTQQLLVEPKSMDAADFGDAEVTAAFARALGVYSRPYAVISVQVPHTLRDVALIGSVCTITSHRLPNIRTGRRGVEAMKALVVRRAWNAKTGRVDLSLIASAQAPVGYAPTVSVTASSGSGTTYTLDVSTMDPTGTFDLAPDGLDMEDMFPVGTRVELMVWDSFSQNAQPGVVTAVAPTTIAVEFDAAASVTGTQYLRYGKATAVTLEAQRRWAYMATDESLVEYASGDETASEFAA